VGDVVVPEGTHHHRDRIGLADVREERIAQTLTAGRSAYQSGDVDEAHGRGHDLFGVVERRQRVEPPIRDGDLADVRLDGRERVVRGKRLRRSRERVEDGRLAHVGKPDDTARQCHGARSYAAAKDSPLGLPEYPGMRQMKVDKLGIDLLTHDPVVILKDLEGKRYLPILIGPFEATAIALALEGTAVPRPLSHDLMRSLLESLSAKLEQIVIHDIKESTFYAKLVVRTNGDVQEIDARPSDGIALALRMHAPIFVSDKIALEETVPDSGKTPEPEEEQKFKKFIEELKPSDFIE
jgi:bifunctional DNase/RNase